MVFDKECIFALIPQREFEMLIFTISIWKVFLEVCMISFYFYSFFNNAWDILQVIFRKKSRKLCFYGTPRRFQIRQEDVTIRKIKETAATFILVLIHMLVESRAPMFVSTRWTVRFVPGLDRAHSSVKNTILAWNTWCLYYNNFYLYNRWPIRYFFPIWIIELVLYWLWLYIIYTQLWKRRKLL